MPKLAAPLRGLWVEFPETEQRQLIGKLKLLGLKLDAAKLQELPGRPV
jgi:hypothetical protein